MPVPSSARFYQVLGVLWGEEGDVTTAPAEFRGGVRCVSDLNEKLS